MQLGVLLWCCFFFFKQKTAYEMRISDWSSDGALPISSHGRRSRPRRVVRTGVRIQCAGTVEWFARGWHQRRPWRWPARRAAAAFHPVRLGVARLRTDAVARCRSEEHTSELQSLMRISYAVFCLKKKNNNKFKKAN